MSWRSEKPAGFHSPNMTELVGEWQQAYLVLQDQTINDDGELVDDYSNNKELLEFLEAIEKDIQRKAGGYAEVIRELTAHSAVIRAEADRLAARANFMKRKAEWLKERLKLAMESIGCKRIVTPYNTIRIQGNGGVMPLTLPDDVKALPEPYRREVITYVPKADAIRETLEAGGVVPGCKLEPRGTHVRVA